MNGRAEHKVDGGKLLRADVAVGDAIEDVALHGDFFIHPEDALADIETALEGVERDADAETLVERITSGIAPGTRLVGFEPRDVARVVTEAVQDAE